MQKGNVKAMDYLMTCKVKANASEMNLLTIVIYLISISVVSLGNEFLRCTKQVIRNF